MAYRKYRLKNPKRAWSCVSQDDWGYNSGFAIETDAGTVTSISDKIGRALTLGVVAVTLWPAGFDVAKRNDSGYENVRAVTWGWCFDRRIVAMVAEFLMRHGWGQGESEPYPARGEAIWLPTEEEADAIYEKYKIPTPQNSQECDSLYCNCVEVGDDGRPLRPLGPDETLT